MGDLTKLIARVEALTGPDADADVRIALTLLDASNERGWSSWQAMRPKGSADGTAEEFWTRPHQCQKYTASLDAAVALTERVLPRWSWSVMRKDFAIARVSRAKGDTVEGYDSVHDFPAIALILATLKALAAKEVEG